VGEGEHFPAFRTGLGDGGSGAGRQSRSPQPLDEDIVHAAALTIHADRDAASLEDAGEVGAGELAA